MRRSTTTRILSMLLALWLAVALTEPAALHACAMHGAGHASANAAGPAPTRPTHHHAAGADAPERQPAGTHVVCTCLGSCSVAGAAALPAYAGIGTAPAPAPPVRVSLAAGPTHEPSAPEHARPPSQGPPLSHD